jgi:5-bromo-4-chloroindolyl phosphate hydrolysis protein
MGISFNLFWIFSFIIFPQIIITDIVISKEQGNYYEPEKHKKREASG